MQQAALLDEIVVPFGVPKDDEENVIASIWGEQISRLAWECSDLCIASRSRATRSLSRIAQLDQRTTSRTNVCSRRKRTCGSQGASPGLDPKLTLGRDNSTDSLSIKYKSPDDAGLEFP